jgi:hypothetical protein
MRASKLPGCGPHRVVEGAIAAAEKVVITVVPTHSKLFPIPTGGLSGVELLATSLGKKERTEDHDEVGA